MNISIGICIYKFCIILGKLQLVNLTVSLIWMYRIIQSVASNNYNAK